MKIVFLLSSFLLISCSGFDITDNEIVDAITQPDYVSSSRAKKLDIPPDLSHEILDVSKSIFILSFSNSVFSRFIIIFQFFRNRTCSSADK